MAGPIEVSETALTPELVEHLASQLKGSGQRLRIFEAAYSGKRSAPVDAAFLSLKTGLTKKQVAGVATRMARMGFFTQLNPHSATYKRISKIAEHKSKILHLASSPAAVAKHVTMRSSKSSITIVKSVRIPKPHTVRITCVSVDDIEEFSKVRNFRKSKVSLSTISLDETKFKEGLLKLLPGTDGFKDWGGERNDIFSQHLTLKGKRVVAAFALKGPFKHPPLTPGKMGKNGDQIQRLVFQAPAKLFVIQYEGSIAVTVYEQLESLLRAKASLTGEKLLYCIIDHMDSTRLRLAYPKEFS
jgi:hypothetical protein